MQENWIAVALMPLVLVLIVFVECSRLHCARRVQRRNGAQLPESMRPEA
jgi:hypothetical protein